MLTYSQVNVVSRLFGMLSRGSWEPVVRSSVPQFRVNLWPRTDAALKGLFQQTFIFDGYLLAVSQIFGGVWAIKTFCPHSQIGPNPLAFRAEARTFTDSPFKIEKGGMLSTSISIGQGLAFPQAVYSFHMRWPLANLRCVSISNL